MYRMDGLVLNGSLFPLYAEFYICQIKEFQDIRATSTDTHTDNGGHPFESKLFVTKELVLSDAPEK